jgi:hypothetical protein
VTIGMKKSVVAIRRRPVELPLARRRPSRFQPGVVISARGLNQKLPKDGWAWFCPQPLPWAARQTNGWIVHDQSLRCRSIASWSALPNPTLKRRLP